MKREQISLLTEAMVAYEAGCPQRVHHFLKVSYFAKTIGELEHLPEETLLLLEAAALVHDIGIGPSLKKYGSGAGEYQEKEGPPEAKKLLEKAGTYTEQEIQRICYLVGRHHTYTNVDGPDCQILIEADFLVNFYEGDYPKEQIQQIYERCFRTTAGKKFCRQLFLEN